MHEQRQNRDCDVKKRANQQHQDVSDSKIAVLENAKIDNRMRRDQFAHEKRNEAGGGDDRAPHNHLRTEPIELLTFIEHDLQAREPNGEQSEADVIDVRGGKLSIRTACEIGINAPPAAPWITRDMIKKPRLPAIPHNADAIVNKVMQPMRNRLRPKT